MFHCKPVLLVTLALFISTITSSGEEEEEEKVQLILLNDTNFEHLTQAATGATTGDWLVLMSKDNKCKTECEKIEKELEKVATLHKNRVNIAKLDTINSRLTLRRFKAGKKASLMFFRLGNQWTYKGEMKKKRISEFVSEGFMRQNGYRVADQLDSFDVWKEDFVKELKASYRERRLPDRSTLLIVLAALMAAVMLLCGYAAAKNPPNNDDDDKQERKKKKRKDQ